MPEHIRREPKVLVSTEALTEQEWLTYRRQGIGGSDVAAILGISPFRTARDLYDDKLNIASAVDDTGNWVALEMGHLLEPLVAQIFTKKTGLEVFQIKKMFQHPQYPFMLADVDYFVRLPNRKIALLEIKTTNYNAKDHWWKDDEECVPIYYETQGRHYDWPALPMSHTEAQNLVANYLRPTFDRNGLDTKIICWDHSYTTTNYKDGSYPLEYYQDASALAATDGSAWHWYEGDEEVMSVVHKEYPTKDIWFTEGSGGEWGFPKWNTAFLNQASSVVNITRNWSKSIIYWNLALDQNGGPDYYYDVNQHQDSTNRGLITINTDTNSWDYNVDYYTLGHISKFVDPGAQRIDSTSLDNNIETVAFKNPDGSKVLVLANLVNEAQEVKVQWGEQSFRYTLLPESMATMTWNGNQVGNAASPIWFNNLESNNNFAAGEGASVAATDSTANLGGSKGIMLTTTQNGDPGTDKQCVIISSESGAAIDASSYQYLTFSVKDMVNPKSATVKVTFVDENGTEVSSWSHEKTVYDNWTRIWVPIAGDKGFDRTRIAKIKLGFYWQGNYAVDDLAFVGGYSDGIPQMNGNLVTNGSFEDDGSAVPVATGWNFEGGTPSATYLEKNSNAASGRFHLVHYSADAHDAYTWQAIYNLPNGTYTLKAMVQSGGGQKQNKILATDFGGSEMSVEIPVNSYWTQVEIGNINVTNGKCTIAFYTEGNAGDWSCVDNIEFYRNS